MELDCRSFDSTTTEFGVVTEFFFSDRNTASEVTVQYGVVRIHIIISEDNLSDSPAIKDQYIHWIHAVNDDEAAETTVDDFYDWLLAGCGPQFSQLVTEPTIPPMPTLFDYCHAKTYHLALHATRQDHFILSPLPHAPAERIHFDRVPDEVCSPWPSFRPAEVMICASSARKALSRPPKKVAIKHGRSFFFKAYDPADSGRIQQELHKYAEIKQAGLYDMRISQLHGLVRDDTGTVLGLLLTYIESASTLACAIGPNVSKPLREKWTQQITETLKCLHDANIIWGDAKPNNILVDIQDDAWIIDFGGGYTEGWVDRVLAETIAGDEQGLSRIISFIDEV